MHARLRWFSQHQAVWYIPSPVPRCRRRVLTPFFWLVIHHRAWNHTFSGVRVSWKTVPAVNEARYARPPPLVQPTPSGLVYSEPRPAVQTEGADAILLAGHPPQSVEPHLQRGARVLENRPGSQRSSVCTPASAGSANTKRFGIFRAPSRGADGGC